MEGKRQIVTAAVLAASKQYLSLIFDQETESDESSAEEDLVVVVTGCREPNYTKKVRIENYVENVIPSYTSSQFKEHFRMNVDAFENLLSRVGPALYNQHRNGRPTINPKKQLLAVIWLLATPDSYRSVGDRFDMSKSSLYHCVVRLLHVLNNAAKFTITWPTRNEDIDKVKRGFSKSGLNNIIGAIDGSYIPIKAPTLHPEVYICRKKFHAITLQAICDSELKFIDCFAGYPSSVNDLRIFKNSGIYKSILTSPERYFPSNEYIIGDKAYPVKIWCITPYINRGNLSRRQIHFNTVLSSVRQAIERAFALLKGRFRRLKYLDMNKLDLVPATILACCVLHNICLDSGDLDEDYISEGMVNYNDDPDTEQDTVDETGDDEAGIIRRDIMARNL